MFCASSSSPGTMDGEMHRPRSRTSSPLLPLEPVHLANMRHHSPSPVQRRRSLLLHPKDFHTALPVMNSMESSAMKKILTPVNVNGDRDPPERKWRRHSANSLPDQEPSATRIPHLNPGAPFTAGLLAAVKAAGTSLPLVPALLPPKVPALHVLVRPPSPAMPAPPTHGYPFGRPRADLNPYPALAAAAVAAAGSRLAQPRPIEMTPRDPIPAPLPNMRMRPALIPSGYGGGVGAPSRRPAPLMASDGGDLPDDAALANMLPRNQSYVWHS